MRGLFRRRLTKPAAGVRRGWIDRWILRRITPSALPWTVNRRRVYILPTRFGVGFGLLCLVMLLGSMNYANSMGFALTFLLAAIGLVSMHHTHAQLVGLRLVEIACDPVHVGADAALRLRVDQPGKVGRLGIQIHFADTPPAEGPGVTVAPSAQLRLSFPPGQRGWNALPLLTVASAAPTGLFRAWTFVLPDTRVLAYPRLARPGGTPPPTRALDQGEARHRQPGLSQFAGLRNYVRGDSLQRIHWKSLPKTRTPMVKQFEDGEQPECWLDLALTPGADLDARLSQLARWVVDLAETPVAFGLRLGGDQIDLDRGPAHRHRCLSALAQFGQRA